MEEERHLRVHPKRMGVEEVQVQTEVEVVVKIQVGAGRVGIGSLVIN